MFFATFILITIYCKHYRLQESVDLGQGDEATKMCDVSRLGLQQEHEIAIFLGLIIVREKAFLYFCGLFEVIGNFILLFAQVS